MSHSHIFFYERFFFNLFPFWRGGVVLLLSCRGCLHILHPNSLSDIQGFSPSDLLLHILESVLKSRRINYLIKDNFFLLSFITLVFYLKGLLPTAGLHRFFSYTFFWMFYSFSTRIQVSDPFPVNLKCEVGVEIPFSYKDIHYCSIFC